jgi:hypothetical protein
VVEATKVASIEAETKESNIFKNFSNPDEFVQEITGFDCKNELRVDDDAEIFIDRVQLALARLSAIDLALILELNEVSSETGKKEKNVSPLNFPVNQLTWQEVTRMALVANIMKALDKPVRFENILTELVSDSCFNIT